MWRRGAFSGHNASLKGTKFRVNLLVPSVLLLVSKDLFWLSKGRFIQIGIHFFP